MGLMILFRYSEIKPLIEIASLSIFDRWGNQLFQQTDGEVFEWDGNHLGRDLKMGVYLYLVELLLQDGEKRVLSGEVLMLR